MSDEKPAAPAEVGPAPCSKCGYNGPGYYQPNTHPCAGQPVEAPSQMPVATEDAALVRELSSFVYGIASTRSAYRGCEELARRGYALAERMKAPAQESMGQGEREAIADAVKTLPGTWNAKDDLAVCIAAGDFAPKVKKESR